MFRAVNSRFLRSAAAITVIAAGFVLTGCSEMYSRTDFATRVKDKSDSEVAKLIGKPSIIDDSKPDRITWTYTSRTFDIDHGNKFDSKTIVVFNKAAADGKLKATEVVFE